MRKTKLILLIIIIFLSSVWLTQLYGQRIKVFLISLGIPIIGILTGIIIAAVGIFLGSIGNLYIIIESLEMESSDSLILLDIIDSIVTEIKQNTLFIIYAISLSLLFFILEGIDQWPLNIKLFKEINLYMSVVLSLIILSFFAVIDSIKAMFKINEYFHEIAKHKIQIPDKSSSESEEILDTDGD